MNWFQSFVGRVVVEALSRVEAAVDRSLRLCTWCLVVHIGGRNRQGADVCERREEEDQEEVEDAALLWQNCRIGADMVSGRGG